MLDPKIKNVLIIEEFYSNHGMYELHFNVVLKKLFDQDKKNAL